MHAEFVDQRSKSKKSAKANLTSYIDGHSDSYGDDEGVAHVICAMVDCPMPDRWPEGATCVATVDSVTQDWKSALL